MQLEFSRKSIRCLGCAVQEVKNVEVTQEIRLPDGMPDIGRVLISWGQIMLRSKQWQAGTIELAGGVKIWSMYIPEDGTQVRTVENWLPFQLRWDANAAEKEGPVRMMPLLQFADSRGISARKMMVRAGVAVMAQGLYPLETEVRIPEDVPEDIQILKQTYPVWLPVEAGEKVFLIDEELDLADAGAAGGKLISYMVNPVLTECKVLSDKVVLKGCANLHMVFQDAEGRIQNRDFDLNFSQLADLDQSHGPEARADVRFGITDLEADMNESGRMRVKCGMVAQYLVDDRHTLELAEDVFSHRRELKFEKSDLMIPAILEERTELMKGEQLLSGQHGQVADARFYGDYPRIRRVTDAVELDIPGVFQILWYGEDGLLQATTARWQGSMSLPADSDVSILPVVRTTGQVQVMTGPDGLVLGNTVQLQLRCEAGHALEMVSEIEAGVLREQEEDRPSLILRRCGGETLWDIAKKTGSTVAAICDTNQITDQPGAERMLLIPIL